MASRPTEACPSEIFRCADLRSLVEGSRAPAPKMECALVLDPMLRLLAGILCDAENRDQFSLPRAFDSARCASAPALRFALLHPPCPRLDRRRQSVDNFR